MRLLKPLSTLFFLTLAVSVTAGSLYVTVKAASQQEGDAFLALPEPAQESVQAVAVSTTVEDEVLDPSAVLHDRQHSITLDENGGFSGRLSSLTKPDGNLASASGMNVKVVRAGRVVASTSTNDDGSFAVSGLSGGVVALLATGSKGLLIYSVNLTERGLGFAGATPVSVDNSIQLDLNSAVVCSSDVALAKTLLKQGVPTADRRFNVDVSEAEQAYPVGTNESSTALSHHQVQLQADGALVGQVNLLDERTGRHREVLDLTVHFLRDGQHVGQTEAQRDGRFVISGLAPGVYSLLTTGEDGLTAIGIDVVGSQAQLPQDSKYRLASVAQVLELNIAPSNAGNINQGNIGEMLEMNDEPTGSDPFVDDGAIIGGPNGAPMLGGPLGSPVGGGPMGMGGGGTTGGGFGGGGGGLGGGGGFGALLGAAAAGAIGFAVGDDNNDPASRAR